MTSPAQDRVSASCAAAPTPEWNTGTSHEVAFWRNILATGGGRWPEDFRNRLDPDFPLQDYIVACIRRIAEPGSVVRLLDAGAGPLTMLGKRCPGYSLEITAVDALADEYDALLSGSIRDLHG